MTVPATESTANLTEQRKVDHIKINLEQDVSFPNLTTGLEHYRFIHEAIPELDLNEIDTATTFLGKSLKAPILISSMTGGTGYAATINTNLARAAEACGLAMGLGSQRAAVERDDLAATFALRQYAPTAMIIANIGVVQFNYGYGVDQCRRAVDMAGADALFLHFNTIQEAVQPEGDVNFKDLLPKIEQVCKSLGVPVIAKEVGWGFSKRAARQLLEVGVSAIDVAGGGGTSWSEVEYHRAPTTAHKLVARAFADWGIPTSESIRYVKEAAPDLPIIASGGLRDGVDIAKSIALGASLGGMAGPFLKVAIESPEAAIELCEVTRRQLQIAMFGAGVGSITDLAQVELVDTRRA